MRVEQVAVIQQHAAKAGIVAEFGFKFERSFIILGGIIRLTHLSVGIGNLADAECHSTLIANLLLDFDRLLQVLQGIGRLVSQSICRPERLQDIRLALLISQLNCKA